MDNRIKIKILLLPHFEIGDITGGFPGEAQLFYQHYCRNSAVYLTLIGKDLYVNKETGIALYVTGPGKVNNTIGLTALLSDPRFDFSESFLFTFGCAGGAYGTCTMGDVCLVTETVDYDLGHRVDPREIADEEATGLWFPENMFKEESHKRLNRHLIEELFKLVQDISLETTTGTREILAESFPKEPWACRDPKVILGTSVSGDNYWKGIYGRRQALRITEYYESADPYAVSEMEDIALANTADQFGMLSRLISMHVCVNMDVFLKEDTPESLWGKRSSFSEGLDDGNSETLDIFETAMYNNFKVGRVIIDHLLTEYCS